MTTRHELLKLLRASLVPKNLEDAIHAELEAAQAEIEQMKASLAGAAKAISENAVTIWNMRTDHDAALARREEMEKQEPVGYVMSNAMMGGIKQGVISDHTLPNGAALFVAAGASPVEPSQATSPELLLGWTRYEKVRKLLPIEWARLHARNLDGENFDTMIDALPKPSTPLPQPSQMVELSDAELLTWVLRSGSVELVSAATTKTIHIRRSPVIKLSHATALVSKAVIAAINAKEKS